MDYFDYSYKHNYIEFSSSNYSSYVMSVFVLANIVNMIFAGVVILGATLICGLLQILLLLKTFKTVLDIPYLTILVAGGISGGISIFTLSLLEKIGF